jgi:hypothetical protein
MQVLYEGAQKDIAFLKSDNEKLEKQVVNTRGLLL